MCGVTDSRLRRGAIGSCRCGRPYARTVDSRLLGVVLVLVVLALIAVVVVVLVVVLQRRRRDQGLAERARRADPLADPAGLSADPRHLKPGDVVQISGETGDYVVRGTLAMVEDGYRWSEHLLDGSTAAGERRHWLSVEDGESGLELVLWDRIAGSDLSPDSAEVAHGGTAFRRDERGRARYSSTGTTGAAESGEVEYVDYLPSGGGPARLGFEKFSTGGSWEVSAGSVVARESLTILHS